MQHKLHQNLYNSKHTAILFLFLFLVFSFILLHSFHSLPPSYLPTYIPTYIFIIYFFICCILSLFLLSLLPILSLFFLLSLILFIPSLTSKFSFFFTLSYIVIFFVLCFLQLGYFLLLSCILLVFLGRCLFCSFQFYFLLLRFASHFKCIILTSTFVQRPAAMALIMLLYTNTQLSHVS